jgi:hypothetical protein
MPSDVLLNEFLKDIGKSSLTTSTKQDLAWAGCPRWTFTGEQSGLWTRMAAESVSSCMPMKC